MISNLHSLIIALVVALAGCATPDRGHQPSPPVHVPESTWWLVDSDIAAASQAATEPAKNFARGSLESWRSRVHQRTEADFIPWFTGYWTQQWLAIKVAWYKLSGGEGSDPAARKLATYLQEQYDAQVLDPVAREIDPAVVRGQVTTLYVQILGEQLQAIPRRHGVPLEQFDRRIKEIPAIALAPPAAHSASLYEIVHADPIARLPAYVALLAQIRKASAGQVAGSADARISPVAKAASERLLARLAGSGGASAAAAAVGGVAGVVISLGAAGFGAIAHASEQPKMQAQLRESLNAALDDRWHSLMEDRATGVMAGVHYLAQQIEGSVAEALAQPLHFAPLPQEVPLAGEQAPEEEPDDDETLTPEGPADE